MTTETAQLQSAHVDAVVSQRPPVCHMKPMKLDWADDGCQQVEYWECEHCGHTKEIGRYLAG
jgi:hypothetical protein